MKRKVLLLLVLSIFMLVGCEKTNVKENETTSSVTTDDSEASQESSTTATTSSAAQKEEESTAESSVSEESALPDTQDDSSEEADPEEVEEGSFDEIIAQYQTAIQDEYDPAQMMEHGLNMMIPECLLQDERAHVGYALCDMDGDGQEELVICANSESEFYTGLIFAVYAMEDGEPQLVLESEERDRWYYAGEGQLLNIGSSSASESGQYLCTANEELAFLDAVEYNAVEYPDDPWLRFTGETWEHITQEEADQTTMEFSYLVSNMEMTEFQ